MFEFCHILNTIANFLLLILKYSGVILATESQAVDSENLINIVI